jgi:hypothetical protein
MYQVLTYMRYNGPQWYAAVLTLTLCLVAFSVFLNVINFEVTNQLEICQPYFFQSDACRKLIRDTIAADADFAAMRQSYQQTAYNASNSATRTVQDVADKVTQQDGTILAKLGLVTDAVQKLGAKYLGDLKALAQQPAAAGQTLAMQLKTLLDATIIDPTLIKYKDPLTRLYNSLI